MATTTVSYDGDGVQADFTITYAYTAQSFVQVYVDAVLKIAGTDYDFNSTTVIRFRAGKIPPSGTNNVELRRVTGTAPLVDWEDGASILESDQDLADLQVLNIVEELQNTIWERVAFSVASASSSIILPLGTVYSRYKVEVRNYQPTIDFTNLLMTISDDDQSSYEAAGYDIRIVELGTSFAQSTVNDQSAFKMNLFSLGKTGTERENHSFEIKLFPGDGTEPFAYYGSGIGRDSGNKTVLFQLGGTMQSTDTAVRATHIKFTASSGNLSTGLFTLWGQK